MTIIDLIRADGMPGVVEHVAAAEKIPTAVLVERIMAGTVVIPANKNRKLARPVGIGVGLSTKVNANIGTSPDKISLADEEQKVRRAIEAGADAIMDLSTGGDIRGLRAMVLKNSSVPVGTVPIYQVAQETLAAGKDIVDIDAEHMFSVIEAQAEEGVDFMTLHCGITRETIGILQRQNRLLGIVSRGGAFLAKWVSENKKENPLYERYDRLLEIAKKHDVTLSLGDGMRPGCLRDASDGAQIAELTVLGELVLRARAAGVQVMVEGPGHMPLDQIQPHMVLAKRLIHDAPYYVLGPLVTDIAAGYDHIAGAIGGAIAASAGADFLCYVTPAEHLRLPDYDDVYAGVMASRIAAHAADAVKNVPGARQRNDMMAQARKKLDWEAQKKQALDPVNFACQRAKLPPQESDVCTMCGKFCAIRQGM